MKRREFLGLTAPACGSVVAGGCGGKTGSDSGARKRIAVKRNDATVYVGRNEDAAAGLRAAVAAAGGLGFIAPGSRVVLKPNAAWSRTPAQAANTDPRLVAAMIKMCKEAGASKITVFEHTIDRPSDQALAVSGIGVAARDAGAELVCASEEMDFVPIEVKNGRLLKRDTLAKVVMDADVFISIRLGRGRG